VKTQLKHILRILLTLIIVAAVIFAAIRLVHRKKASLAAARQYKISPVAVHTSTSHTGTWERVMDYLAIAEPVQTATVSARLVTTTEAVFVEEGDTVKAGQLLAKLDDREIEEAIASIQAQIDQVQAEQDANEATVKSLKSSLDYWNRESQRITSLQEGGAATVSEADAAREQVNQFNGRLESALHKTKALEHQAESLKRRLGETQTRLSYCSIISPFDGVVSERNADPGDQTAPGKTILTIQDQSRLRLAFDVPQQDVPKIQTGMSLSYAAPDGNIRKAAVNTLYPSLNNARMMRAEAVLDNDSDNSIVSGAYVRVSLTLARRESVVFVPSAAVVESPEKDTYVFVVEDDRLKAVPVKVIGNQQDQTAVEGLEAGEQVVVSTFLGWSELSSGLAVEVRQ
jgi:RND family efflux transporter MFP subunit